MSSLKKHRKETHMNSTLFLQMFGLDPDQFEEGIAGPEETESGWAMSLVQRSDRRTCPLCHKADAAVVKDRRLRKLRHAMPDGRPGVILIERPRMLCRRCSRSFYPDLRGVSGKSRMTATEASSMKADLMGMETFAAIAVSG